MVYQEQVMRILNRLGGIELSQAYACIKAISKKKTEVIAQAAGAVPRRRGRAQGLARRRPPKIFDLIVFFGGYGFNKSHSTAYALVAYQTAYLKAHYPTEFMAALLSSEIDGAERDKLRRAHRRLPADGDRGPAARHQPRVGRVPGRRGGQDRLRPLGDQGGRPEGGRGDRGGPRGGGAVREPRRPLRARPAGDGHPGVRRGADQGGRLRRLRGPPQPVAGRPAPRRAGGPGEPERPQARPGEPLRRLRVERLATNPPPRARACPTSPSCPTPSAWPRRRRSSASTCRATR